MSEVIDLTNDDIQPTKRKPTCKHCRVSGHTIRGCNDPYSLNVVRQLQQMVNRFPPFQTIVDWLETIEEKYIQFVLARYSRNAIKPYHKNKCIDILKVIIQEQYEQEKRRYFETTEGSLRRGNILVWSFDNENIPQLYRQYCAQFIENETEPVSDVECELLCNIIITRSIPQNTSYHTMRRFYAFILYRHAMFEAAQSTNVDNVDTQIKYIVMRKPVSFKMQIECPICMDSKETPDIVSTTCHHRFCWSCIYSAITTNKTQRCGCPLCRKPIYKLIRETL